MAETRLIQKQLAGVEDLLLGIGTATQTRATGPKTITKINADRLQGALVVDTIDELLALNPTLLVKGTCIVKDENRGGVFVYQEANALVNNGGTIFNGWTRQYDGAVNVKWFGAKGDGVTDDTLAFQSAVALNDKIFIPKGDHLLTEHLLVNATGTLVLDGVGAEESRLIWNDTALSVGIKFNYISTSYPTIGIEKIGFYRGNNAQGGIAIEFTGVIGGSYPDVQRGYIRDCKFRALERDGVGRFDIGIYTKNVSGLLIDNAVYSGSLNATGTAQKYDSIFLWQDDDDNNTEVSSHHSVNNCQATKAHKAIKASSSEGMFINQCRFFNVDYGVEYDNAGQVSAGKPTTFAPRFHFINGHISAKIRAFKLTYSTGARISGNDLLFSESTDKYGFQFIESINSTGCIIQENEFGSNNIDVHHITFDKTTDSIVSGNYFNNASTNNTYNAYYIRSINGSGYNIVSDNLFRFDTYDNIYNDSTSHTNLINGTIEMRGLASSQSIPATTDTLIQFESIYRENLGNTKYWNIENPTKLTIPIKGKYRISTMLLISVPTIGQRIETDILINGANVLGSGKAIQLSAKAGGNDILNAYSNILTLNPADTITIQLWCSSTATIIQNSLVQLEYIGT